MEQFEGNVNQAQSEASISNVPQDDSFEIQCYVTREDWIAANIERTDESAEWTEHFRRVKRDRVAKAVLGTGGVAIVVGLIMNYQYGWTYPYNLAVVLIGIFTTLIVGLIVESTGRKDPRASYIKSIRASDYSSFTGPTRAVCTPTHVLFERDDSTYTLPWRRVLLWATTNFLMFGTYDSSYFVFPLKVFGDSETQKRRVDQIKAWMANAALSESERVILWLKDRSAPCPKCRYQLANLQVNRCPECGHVLTVGELNARAEMRAV